MEDPNIAAICSPVINRIVAPPLSKSKFPPSSDEKERERKEGRSPSSFVKAVSR